MWQSKVPSVSQWFWKSSPKSKTGSCALVRTWSEFGCLRNIFVCTDLLNSFSPIFVYYLVLLFYDLRNISINHESLNVCLKVKQSCLHAVKTVIFKKQDALGAYTYASLWIKCESFWFYWVLTVYARQNSRIKPLSSISSITSSG